MSAENNNERLGSAKIPGLVCSYALTTFTALLLNSVYTLTDTLFVSWGVGSDAMGGVSIVFPFVIIQSAIATALGGGAASLVSRSLGGGKSDKAGKYAASAMIAFYTTAVVTTVLGFIFMEPLLRAMGVTKELYEYSRQYLTIILAGNIFSTGFSSIIRAEGKMTYGLLIWVIPICINIALDALFVLVFRWGVMGSAGATLVCQMTSAFMALLFFTRFTSLSFKNVKLSFKAIGEILAVGIPSLVQIISLSISLALMNNVLGSAGATLEINSFAYVTKIISFAVIPITAISQALSPIAGYNYGNGNTQRVKKALGFSILLCSCCSLIAFALLEIIPSGILGFFTDSAKIIETGAAMLRITALSILFKPVAALVGTAFQATGKKLAALIMYASEIVFLFPLALLLPSQFGLGAIWWAYTLSGALSCATALTTLLFMGKRISSNKQ